MKSTDTVPCAHCDGSGLARDGRHGCGSCMGLGHVERDRPAPLDQPLDQPLDHEAPRALYVAHGTPGT